MAETKRPRGAKAATAKKTKAAPAGKPKKSASKKAKAATKPRPAARRAAAASSSGFDLVKLIDHPLVADLLAVGAIAAVAAIAEHNVQTRTGEAERGSSRAVKAAGKAAAAAIGKRLMTEVDAVRKASAAKPKRGSR